jgi:hypothetical protein
MSKPSRREKMELPFVLNLILLPLGIMRTPSGWEPGDVHAPSDQLLTTLAVNMGQTQKQGDCKNAFLHPTLPPDEIVIV